MKPLIALILFSISAGSCAMGSPRPVVRKEQDKLYRPCQDFEVAEPVGKLCSRTCEKLKEKQCVAWKTTIKNFSDKVDFEFFRTGTFIMIDEDNL